MCYKKRFGGCDVVKIIVGQLSLAEIAAMVDFICCDLCTASHW